MFNKKVKRTSMALLTSFALLFSAFGITLAAVTDDATALQSQSEESGKAPDEVLKEAVQNYKAGKFDAAVAALKDHLELLNDKDSKAKKYLAVFQIKAGHPDESARLIREVLLQYQMMLPIVPQFSTDPAPLFAEMVVTLKDSFTQEVLKELGEGAEMKAIVDSLIAKTVPKDYSVRLKSYCRGLQEGLKPLNDLRSITDSEQLKYGDPFSSLDVDDKNKNDPRLSRTNLDKIGAKLDELASEAQQMPVGDARPALSLCQVALAANSAGRYDQAESFAQKSIAHTKALFDKVSGLPDAQIVLAFAYARQRKIAEFKALKDELLKNYDGRERLLVTLARFTDATGDGAGALDIYKIAIDNRKKNGNGEKPEWFDEYKGLLKKESEQPEIPKHDMFQQ